MANRPLPNVDPDALSKLASQYPGSSDGRAEPKLGGSGGGGGSTGGGPGDGGGDRPSAKAGAVTKPETAVKPAARSGAVWPALFAGVAIVAAFASLAAPSLRSEARALLQRYIPQMEAKTVDLITGHDTRRLEVTYDGLDQRIATLTEALGRIAAAPGLDPAAARELLLKTEQNQRLSAVEAANADQKSALDGITGRLDGVDQQIAGLDEVRQSVDALGGRAASAEQALTALQDTLGAVQAKLASLEEADAQAIALIESMSGRFDALSAEITKAHERLVPVAELTNRVAEQRKSMELPLIGMTQLRIALDRDTPFKMELALAKQLVGDDKEALAALATLDSQAGTGVASLRSLRRDFAFAATQMGGSLTVMRSWTQRLSSWVEVLVGTRSVPEADPIGQISSAIASIDAVLEAGQLDLAINEAVALNNRQSDVLLDGWIVEARRRLATERAYDQLSARIYARIATPG
ncbi:hypothetical protein [Thalassobaculum sp.]|uniref:hypothetical protein n=1 Tax=Thalassobaculum sp. TaxID=2022740 RepID=UPI0032EBCC7F